jgi:hypothetical protein
MHEKPLGFGRMHKNKIFFCFILNEYLFFKIFYFFYFFEVLEETKYFFNIGSVSYNILQPDMMQNYRKNIRIFLKCPLENLKFFF